MPQVTGPITTTSSVDTYPTHDSITGLGSLREVADYTARNAISNARRREGMLVYTANDQTYWKLSPSPWLGTDADWTVYNTFSTGIVIPDELGNYWQLLINSANGALITSPFYASSSDYPSEILSEDGTHYLITEDTTYFIAQEAS
jgi:hypothetical protein